MARKAVDLFSGSGGVTAGLKKAGWEVLAAVDNDAVAAATYRKNHPEVTFIQADIRKRSTIASLRATVGANQVDLLVICAPCQPFSSQNRKRGNDPREDLIVRSLSAVRALRPQLIFFENVPGLAGPNYQGLLASLFAALKRVGYSIRGPSVEDAASYGVPQRRRRCIMVAARTNARLDRFGLAKASMPRRTVRDAIVDLPVLASGQSHPTDPLHRARIHQEIALARLRVISPDGGSRTDLPAELVLDCHKTRKGFPDVYGRMKWNDVAPTLTTGCTDVTRGRFAHPEQDRAITLREAARLQSFSDEYSFIGNASQIATQIGNAVPPAMITALARAFEAALDG